MPPTNLLESPEQALGPSNADNPSEHPSHQNSCSPCSKPAYSTQEKAIIRSEVADDIHCECILCERHITSCSDSYCADPLCSCVEQKVPDFVKSCMDNKTLNTRTAVDICKPKEYMHLSDISSHEVHAPKLCSPNPINISSIMEQSHSPPFTHAQSHIQSHVPHNQFTFPMPSSNLSNIVPSSQSPPVLTRPLVDRVQETLPKQHHRFNPVPDPICHSISTTPAMQAHLRAPSQSGKASCNPSPSCGREPRLAHHKWHNPEPSQSEKSPPRSDLKIIRSISVLEPPPAIQSPPLPSIPNTSILAPSSGCQGCKACLLFVL